MKRINQILWLGLMTVLIMPAWSDGGPFDPQENPLAQVPPAQTWYPLTSDQPAPPEISFEGDEIVVTLPGFFYTTKTVNDKEYSQITIPKHALIMNEGFPELPKVRFNMAIPKDAKAHCELIDVDAMDLELKTPIPSRGDILRDVDPATVPYVEGEFYRGDKAFPCEEYHVDSTFVFRGTYGLPIEFYPIQYDPREDLLRVYKTIRIKCSIEVDAYRAFAFKRTNREFDEMFKETFVNYQVMRTSGSLSEPGRLIIITADAFIDAVRPLAEWKIQRGLKTEIVKISEIGTTGEAIKSYITTQYQSPESLTYVVLVGDSDTIPTLYGTYEGAACDSCMAMVDGNDPYPDLFISRLSARTVAGVENQVNKFIRYEKNPDIDGAWYLRGIGVACDEGPTHELLCWVRIEELRIALEAYGFTEVAKIYDPGATKDELVAALNNGASVLNYDGHGSVIDWGTTGFRYTSTSLLTNGYMNPFIVDTACSTGAFTSSSYPSCLAESFLQAGTKEQPAGAIAMYAASKRVNWVVPSIMQSAVIKDLLVTNLKHTTGGLYFGGIVAMLNVCGTTGGYGLRTVEEYNIFGDASLSVRSKKPAVLDVTYPSILPPTGPVEIEVFTQNNAPFFDATVALTYRGSIVSVAQTNIAGVATLEYAPIEGNPLRLLLTVFAPNTVPVCAELVYSENGLKLLTPVGGEFFRSGKIYPINWETGGAISDVLIEYSPDNGSSWIGVAPSNSGNTGSYDWLVPMVVSKQCLVRISDSLHPEIYDVSARAFEIVLSPVQNTTTGKRYDYIQDAIDDASAGDHIVADKEVYQESIDFKGKGVKVSSRDPGDLAVVARTIIRGAGSAVTFATGETGACVVAGFTIEGTERGVYCYGASPAITNCIIAECGGPGVELFKSSRPEIANCRIVGNGGCGIKTWTYPGPRGPLYNYPTITKCVIAENQQEGIFGCIPTINNCTIVGNLAGGVNCYWPTVTNSIIYYNGEDSDGPQIVGSNAAVAYSNVEGSWHGLGNIDVDPCFVDLAHWNPNGTPDDLDDDFWVDSDYHLKSRGWRWDITRKTWTWDIVTSRCIDAGNPGSPLGDEPLSVPVDPTCYWGRNLRVNMGAYGGTSEASIAPLGLALQADLTNDGAVNWCDFACAAPNRPAIVGSHPGDLNRDGATNSADIALLADDWLNQTAWCE